MSRHLIVGTLLQDVSVMVLSEKGENYIKRSLEKDQAVLASSGVTAFAPLSSLAQ